MMFDRITIHNLMPGDPFFWQKEVEAYLKMSRKDQLEYWRERRRYLLDLNHPHQSFSAEEADPYFDWIKALAQSLNLRENQVEVPPEIQAEEKALGIDYVDIDDGGGLAH